MAEINLKDITIEMLLQTPLVEGLQKAVAYYERLQETVYRLMEKDDEESLTRLKVGTILTWAVLNKLAAGKKPDDFSKEDWKDIADAVSKYAIMMDDRDYTAFVFLVYAKCIDDTAIWFDEQNQSDRADAIRALAEELRTKTTQLEEGAITEPAYVEECLWICLEAVLKILCTYLALADVVGCSEFAEGGLLFALQYARLKMYQREQALLEKYLANQKKLDKKLDVQYQTFLADLNEDAEEFNALIIDAFSADFRTALRGSAELARAAGVAEAEILDSVEEVDEFFI